MKLRWLRRGAVVVLVVIGGFLLVTSGVVPIAASSGHWAPTAWFLGYAMRRSVSTHALGVPELSFDEPWLVEKGAGHYEHGCRPCHGSPGLRAPRVAAAMTPHPPDLSRHVPTWDAGELFYIVKHGVKFTGMPAFPAQRRDDEVLAVVAFLLEMPGMDAAEYRRLVQGDDLGAPLEALVPDPVIATCARCHGAAGESRSAAFPRLAGQRREYLRRALRAYASGARESGIMAPIAAALEPGDIEALADWYHDQTPVISTSTRAQELLERGRRIAERGIPERRVPSCSDCHGPGGGRRNDAYPLLAGQHADYLVLQLELFAAGRRGGSAYAHLMKPVATKLEPDEMRAVAEYYASVAAAEDEHEQGEDPHP